MSRRNKESGQALIFGVATLGILLIGIAGLGIDVGFLRYEKRLQQTAADHAALAGAAEIPYASSTDLAGVAKQAAAANGFSVGSVNLGACPPTAPATAVGSISVTVNNPPCSGPHSGDVSYVEAYVAQVQPTFFMKVLGVTSQTITARAVAYWGTGSGKSCVYTLGNPGTGIQGVTNSGTPTLNAPTCGIDDNGDFCTNGNGVIITAGSIGVAGTAGGSGKSCQGGTVTPAPITGIAPADDPLGFLTAPAVSAPGVNFNQSGTIAPGTTYKSISINGGGTNGTCPNGGGPGISTPGVVFPGGTYIVNGSMTINGSTVVCGTGVTFYVTNGGSVSINGNTSVQFTAPTTGTYAGILFYQDPNDTSAATINGTSFSVYEGALYFPRASVDFGGTGTTFNSGANYTMIVSDALKISGTATVDLNSNLNALPGGNPIKTETLVE